jgi:hypothetical protein
MIEDSGHILLEPWLLGGVMGFPEDVQQLLIGDLGGVEFHLDRFRMVADVLVVGVYRLAAGIADARPDDPGNAPEPGVRTPESAQGEGGNFRLCVDGGINGWFR